MFSSFQDLSSTNKHRHMCVVSTSVHFTGNFRLVLPLHSFLQPIPSSLCMRCILLLIFSSFYLFYSKLLQSMFCYHKYNLYFQAGLSFLQASLFSLLWIEIKWLVLKYENRYAPFKNKSKIKIYNKTLIKAQA